MKKHLEHLSRAKLAALYQVMTAVAVVTALIVYFQSSFLKTLIGEQYIGAFFSVSYALTLLAIFLFPALLKKAGTKNTLLGLLAALMTALAVLAFGTPKFQLIALVIYEMLIALIGVNLDVFIETFSRDSMTGRIRGRAYTYMNIAWVLTPAISGWMASKYGFLVLFASAFLVIVPFIVLVLVKFKHEKTEFNHQPPLKKILRDLWKNTALLKIFYISFLLSFFYAWMIIYTPLYLVKIGFEPYEIGRIFSVMLLPFVLLQYPAGWLADKIFGEKEIITFGILTLSLATISLYFISSPSILLWILLLFLTRVGASLIEIMRDTYFFKQIDFRDIHLTSLFRNTTSLAHVIAPLVATLALQFYHLEMKALFLVLGGICLTGLFASLTLKDTK